MGIASRPVRRNAFFREADGTLATLMHRGEKGPIGFDWTADLATGETITTSAWTYSGPALTALAIVGTTTTATVTGTNGWVENQITTSTGRVLVDGIRIRGFSYDRCNDYGS